MTNLRGEEQVTHGIERFISCTQQLRIPSKGQLFSCRKRGPKGILLYRSACEICDHPGRLLTPFGTGVAGYASCRSQEPAPQADFAISGTLGPFNSSCSSSPF